MKHFILIIMLIMLSSFALADGSEWTEYQYNEQGEGAPTLDEAFTDLVTGDISSAPLNVGSNFQPLIGDIDNDTVIETIVFDGSILTIYNTATGSYSAEASVNIGASVSSQAYMADIDGNGYYNIVVPSNGFLYQYEYNGTGITELNKTYNYSSVTIGSGVSCHSGWVGYSDYICYATASGNNLIEYYPQNGTGNIVSIGVDGQDTSSSVRTDFRAPLIADIDIDGRQEIVFLGQSEVLYVIDEVTMASQWSADFPTLNGAPTFVTGLIIHDLDNAGDSEVCATMYESPSSDEDAYIRCYNSDGSVYATETYDTISSVDASVSAPVMIDVNNDGSDYLDLCVVFTETGGDIETEARCYDLSSPGIFAKIYDHESTDTFTTFFEQQETNDVPIASGGKIKGATTQGFIVGKVMYFYNASSDELARQVLSELSATASTIVADSTGDGILDLIQYDGNVRTMYSSVSITNEIPELNNTFEYGGYGANVDYRSPVCVNTSLTFDALEDSNYNNDIPSDRERLLSNCGQQTGLDDNLDTGLFFTTAPVFTCVYNDTGLYSVRIYIEDDANTGDRTQFNTQTITVNVIDGVSGSTCNLPPIPPGSTDLVTTTTEQIDDSIANTIGILTGTSTNMKLLLAFAIIISLVVMGAQNGITHPFALGLIGIMGVAFVSFFGLLPMWVMVLLILVPLVGGLYVVTHRGGN